MNDSVIDLIVSFGPTILFLLILICGIILGLIRGFRKSLILAIHAVVALAICLIGYFIVVNNKEIDVKVVTVINSSMGEGYLQDTLEVSTNAGSLKEILVEFIPKNLDFGDGLELVVKENGAYLGALVDLAYNIIFAIVFVIFYYILIFLLYIVYLIFYPERRYKKKTRRKESSLQSEKSYKKRPLFGALIGGTRGLVQGLVCMSLIGALFFVLAGGAGDDSKAEDYDFGSDDMNLIHSAYQSIGDYGTGGIYKIMNAVKDSKDIPYYIYAVDIVFSGGCKDPDTNIKANIALTRELKAYTEFGRKTFDLILKYDSDGMIRKIVLDEAQDLDIMEEISKIFAKEEFQNEFNSVIDEFDGETYFIDLGLSLIDSIVKHFDELSFSSDLSPDVVEIINILFKPGYKSSYIPEDQNVETPAYITASNILTKDDAKNLVKSAVALLGVAPEGDNEVIMLTTYAEGIIPTITDLSLIGQGRKEEINPLLQRIYSYITNRYLSKEDEVQEQINVKYVSQQLTNTNTDLDWVTEIHSLLELASNALTITGNVYEEDKEVIDIVFDIFDDTKATYQENQEAYKVIKDSLTSSSLLSLIMSETDAYQMLEDAIIDMAPEAYLPDDIIYINEKDSEGNIVKYGEVYNLLTAVERVLKDDESKDLVNRFMSEETDLEDMEVLMDLLSDSIDILYKEENNQTIIDCILESRVVESVVSGFILSNKELSEDMNLVLYIPEESLQQVNGQTVNLLKKDEIKQVLDLVPDLFDAIKPSLGEDENGEFKFSDVNGLIDRLTKEDSPVINDLLESLIIEGTLANVLSGVLTAEGMDEFIVMPVGFVNEDGTTNTEEWIKANEVSNLVYGIAKSGLDFDTLMEGELSNDQTLDIVKDLSTNGNMDLMLESKILHYTVSGLLIDKDYGDFKILVPNSSLETDKLINKIEIKQVIKQIPNILPEDLDNIDTGAVLKDVVAHNEELLANPILLTTVVNYVVTELVPSMPDTFVIPEYLTDAGDLDVLKQYDPNATEDELNPWHNEAPALVDALDILLGISDLEEDESLDLENPDAINETVLNNVTKLNDLYVANDDQDSEDTKLDIVYNSVIIKATLAKTLDDSLSDEDLIDQNAKNNLKTSVKIREEVAYTYYEHDEVEALVNSINELELDITDINITTTIDKLDNFNEPSNLDPSKSKLNVVYSY